MKRKKIVLIMILFVLFVNGCVESKKENIVRKNIKRNSSEVKKIINTTKEESDVKELYKKLELNGKLEYRIFQMAMKGFEIISPKQKKYIAIVDFTQNSTKKRFFSLGFYVTGEAYYGSNGYSLRLDGLDKGLNDNARKRDIVIHGAPYVSESSISEMNRIGRSWGCPALSPTISEDVIEKLKDGNLLFVYANNYEKDSTVLRS